MRHAQAMARRSTVEVPADLRSMDLTPFEIPQRLIRRLFELDADYAEALWALDQPPGTLDLSLPTTEACNMVPGRDPQSG